MIILVRAAWAVVREVELPSSEISASDNGVFVNSLPREIVVTYSTLEMRYQPECYKNQQKLGSQLWLHDNGSYFLKIPKVE